MNIMICYSVMIIKGISDKKIELREKYRKLRKEVQDKKEASYSLLQNYVNNIIIEETSVISGYIPIDGEIDVLPLMNHLMQQKHIVAVPVINQNSKTLLFYQWNTINSVIPNILIVPLIAFDKCLNRLGFGGGYYDSTISKLRPTCKVIGVAYDIQLCDVIPIESHDEILDIVITEKKIYKHM